MPLPPPGRGPFPGGAALRLILTGLAVTLMSCSDSSSRRKKAPPAPLAVASYIGSTQCGVCHGPDIPAAFEPTYHDDWQKTAHGRAGNTAPSEQNIVADADQSGTTDFMDGLDLHYYSGNHGGPARDFDEKGWFHLMKRAWYTEELLAKHSTIMDRYDPEKRVALVVAEWGTWHKVEPGTNPGFLYQQSKIDTL